MTSNNDYSETANSQGPNSIIGYAFVAALAAGLTGLSGYVEYNHYQTEHSEYLDIHQKYLQGSLHHDKDFLFSSEVKFSCFNCDYNEAAKDNELQKLYLENKKPSAVSKMVTPIGCGIISLVALSCVAGVRRENSSLRAITRPKTNLK